MSPRSGATHRPWPLALVALVAACGGTSGDADPVDAAVGPDATPDPELPPLPGAREPNPDCQSRPPAEDGRPWCDNTGPTHRSLLTTEFAEGFKIVEVAEAGGTVVKVARRVGDADVVEDSPVVSRDDATGRWLVQHFVSRGKVTVDASGVALRNFRVHGSIDVADDRQDVLLLDGEIRDMPGAALGGSHFLARRLHVHHGDSDFVNADSDLTIERSYFHHGGLAEGAHADAIQYGQARVGHRVTYRENFFYMPFQSAQDALPPLPSDAELSPHLHGLELTKANAILQLHAGNADLISEFLFDGNWFHGSNNGIGVSDEYALGFTFTNNRWECNEPYESGTYVVRTDLGAARWSGNVHYQPDTGATIEIPPDYKATHGGQDATTLDCDAFTAP